MQTAIRTLTCSCGNIHAEKTAAPRHAYNSCMEFPLWAIWAIIGLVALIVDIVLTNTYYLLWLGVAALFTALLTIPFPGMPFWLQGGIYAAIAVGLLSLAARYWPRGDLKNIRGKLLGQQAIVVDWFDGSGTIRLQAPTGGSDTWKARSIEEFKAGDNATISDFDTGQKVVIISRKS